MKISLAFKKQAFLGLVALVLFSCGKETKPLTSTSGRDSVDIATDSSVSFVPVYGIEKAIETFPLDKPYPIPGQPNPLLHATTVIWDGRFEGEDDYAAVRKGEVATYEIDCALSEMSYLFVYLPTSEYEKATDGADFFAKAFTMETQLYYEGGNDIVDGKLITGYRFAYLTGDVPTPLSQAGLQVYQSPQPVAPAIIGDYVLVFASRIREVTAVYELGSGLVINKKASLLDRFPMRIDGEVAVAYPTYSKQQPSKIDFEKSSRHISVHGASELDVSPFIYCWTGSSDYPLFTIETIQGTDAVRCPISSGNRDYLNDHALSGGSGIFGSHQEEFRNILIENTQQREDQYNGISAAFNYMQVKKLVQEAYAA